MKEVWTSLASLMGVFAFMPDALPCRVPGGAAIRLPPLLQLLLLFHLRPLEQRLPRQHLTGVCTCWEPIVTQRQSQSFSFRPLPDKKQGFTPPLSPGLHVPKSIPIFHARVRNVEDYNAKSFFGLRKKDKSPILHSYLDYIMASATEIRCRNQDHLLYTNSRGRSLESHSHLWEFVPFKHHSTFYTLAMDHARKDEIMADLRVFADGEAFYQKTGHARKR